MISFFLHREAYDGMLTIDIVEKNAMASCSECFDYINSQHPNIRFTMEKETDHVLPFLDVTRFAFCCLDLLVLYIF